MEELWKKKRVLITARTYPTPSKKVNEASCTAGICDGKWIRLFPIPYRLLEFNKRFKKYQIIEVDTIKPTSDVRPESYKINPDTIKIVNEVLPTDNKWELRKSIILPLKNPSLCSLYHERDQNGRPTLGLIKPKIITALRIQKPRSKWSVKQRESLLQTSFAYKLPKIPLEELPYIFFYEFVCEEPECKGHKLSCTDWEIGESYLSWSRKYGNKWEQEFRKTYESEMIYQNDTYFFVGTVHDHPSEWVIIGLFYPPKSDSLQANLFPDSMFFSTTQ